jgi:hypothetical protein
LAKKFVDESRNIGFNDELEQLANALDEFAFDRAGSIVKRIAEMLGIDLQ